MNYYPDRGAWKPSRTFRQLWISGPAVLGLRAPGRLRVGNSACIGYRSRGLAAGGQAHLLAASWRHVLRGIYRDRADRLCDFRCAVHLIPGGVGVRIGRRAPSRDLFVAVG